MTYIQDPQKYIFSIDFSQLLEKLEKHSGWLKDDALKTSEQYRNFLFLKKKYPDVVFAPSEDIDCFWHEHILDTQKYIHDCQNIFGEYLHHYPYFGIDAQSSLDDLNNSFEVTQEYYAREFGCVITPTRSKYPKILYKMMLLFKNHLS